MEGLEGEEGRPWMGAVEAMNGSWVVEEEEGLVRLGARTDKVWCDKTWLIWKPPCGLGAAIKAF